MVRDANVVETTFKEGLCEVEMEIILSHSQFQY
jgi:outer membrane protein FlgP